MQEYNTDWIENDGRRGRINKWQIDKVLTFMHQQRTTSKVNQDLVTLPSNSEDFINKLKGWTPSTYNVRDFQRACINIVNNSCLPDESKDALIKELVTTPLIIHSNNKVASLALACLVIYQVALAIAVTDADGHNHENSTQFFTALLNNKIYLTLMVFLPIILLYGLLKACFKPNSISDNGQQFMEVIRNVAKEINRIPSDNKLETSASDETSASGIICSFHPKMCV